MNTLKRAPVVNEFNIHIATINGSGSQTTNAILLRTIFRMGVPVSGKNLFPSNISGLPTWFDVRISERGYAAHKAQIDFAILLNPRTAHADALAVSPGGALLAESSLGLKGIRSDIEYYEVPFSQLAASIAPDFRLRRLLANTLYLGAAAHLLSLDSDEVENSFHRQFQGKASAVELNMKAYREGFRYAKEHLSKTDPFRVERRTLTQDKILIDGNGAAALGAVFAGCTVAAWYPITPSTSLIEQLQGFLKEHRLSPETGKATFAVVQTEDELAAIGMVVGAGWAGARAMTATSGPGISLMAEFSGLAYFAEIPAVIWDVQRVGPSTGLPTRTSQGDILSCHFLSHGDTCHILLIPGTVEECFRFAQQAFNLAERFQTPVFCMSDLDLGMNDWVADEFQYPDDIPPDRGKVLSETDVRQLEDFARYLDADGDGIPYRTIPGNRHPAAAYFNRGTGHNEKAEYSERPEDYAALMERLARKIRSAAEAAPPPVVDAGHASVGILAYGSTHPAVEEARDRLRDIHGIATDYIRVRALPSPNAVHRFLKAHSRVYAVEQNRDGQMRAILAMEYPDVAHRLRSVLHCSGIPIDARFIAESILEQESEGERHDN